MLAACADNVKRNRLASSTSPYLRQHADNPVNWYEWGDEPLALAKKENKPLLISIGYASCHWCHEMEKDSFMDTAVARIMNEYFICIKVDREERPDIDNVYMYACKLITGGDGGWPLNAFALPDGKPFFAGTYYTKASWKNLLVQIATAYKEKNALVVKQAEELTKGIADETLAFNAVDSTAAPLNKIDYQKCFDSVYSALDTVNGGLKGNVKFPMPTVTEFLLLYYYQTGNKKAIDIAKTTLKKLALGGIYDQVGGGFARYATDPQWGVPHFEKMLYDNAQLISLYAHAYQLTKDDFYKRILNECILFIERELASENGGYYSSVNADTENGEGNFYSWSEKEFKNVIRENPLIAEYFNVSSSGNWKNGKNLLSSLFKPEDFANTKGIEPRQFVSQLDSARAELLRERNKRSRPQVDTKILTSWNAMLLKAYADAFVATGEKRYLIKAYSLANFLEKNAVQKDGKVWRLSTGGNAIDGFLDDYAWTALALVKLYEVSFDKHWLDLANQITSSSVANFFNQEAGMFHYAYARGSKLVLNNIETTDEAIPSSNAIMAILLHELGIMFDNDYYKDLSNHMLNVISGKMKMFPAFHTKWLSLAGILTGGVHEVAVMGENAKAVNTTLQRSYLPDCIFMGETDKENLPLLEQKLVQNKTLIYVCTNKVCKKPVEEVGQALMAIKTR